MELLFQKGGAEVWAQLLLLTSVTEKLGYGPVHMA